MNKKMKKTATPKPVKKVSHIIAALYIVQGKQ